MEALEIAEGVGRLPLALNLVAARIMRGSSWSDLKRALESEVARLETLDPTRRRRDRLRETRVEASFNMSLEYLKREDKEAWEVLIWLGVLREDVNIIAPVVATITGKTWEETDCILELLWEEALLLPGSGIEVDGRRWNGYRLHDLVHDVARRLLVHHGSDDPSCSTLRDAHAVLLNRYGEKCGDRWADLRDDGYIHEHLVWHMEKAGDLVGLHALLCLETSEGRNAWYEPRYRLGQTAGYLADVRRAWRVSGDDIGLQCRYALVITTLNGLAHNLPAELLRTMVEKGIWSVAQGLAFGRQAPTAAERAHALAVMLPVR